MYSTLFNKIEKIVAISEKTEETWSSLSLFGRFKQQYSKTFFQEMYDVLGGMGKAGCITFKIGNIQLPIEELLDLLVDGVQWTVNINKQSFMGGEEEISNFFYKLDAFKQWAEHTDPFSASNPLNSHVCKIEVNGLPHSFGGPNFLVSDNIGDIPNNEILFYEYNYLNSVLRQFTDTKREIHPERHYISTGNVDDYSTPFFRNSLMCLTIGLCDELYEDKVVLRGIRRLEFGLQSPQYDNGQMAKAQESLYKAFCWVFNEDPRFELRHKLLMDRLTLDLPQNQSFYDGIIPLIEQAAQQAKERYNYAFFERSNEYQKELQQFLKELHGLCDSFSMKVRSILGNFLRDALAGVLTVAITVFARVKELEKLDTGNVLNYIFCAFGIYLLVSCLVQVIIDWKDLYLSEKEIDYWKTVSREYMREEDFDAHKKKTVIKRKYWAARQYAFVAILYIALALFSFHVPEMWKGLFATVNESELTKEISNAENVSGNSITIDSLKNGKNSLSGDRDTAVCHSQGWK